MDCAGLGGPAGLLKYSIKYFWVENFRIEDFGGFFGDFWVFKGFIREKGFFRSGFSRGKGVFLCFFEQRGGKGLGEGRCS